MTLWPQNTQGFDSWPEELLQRHASLMLKHAPFASSMRYVSSQVLATRNGSHSSCSLETTYQTRFAGLREPTDSRPKQAKRDSQKARSRAPFHLKTHAK